MEEKLTQKSIDKLLEYLSTVNVEKFRQFEKLNLGWFVGFNAADKNMYVNALYNPPELVILITKGSKQYELDPIICSQNQLAETAKNNLDRLVSNYSKPSQEDELNL